MNRYYLGCFVGGDFKHECSICEETYICYNKEHPDCDSDMLCASCQQDTKTETVN